MSSPFDEAPGPSRGDVAAGAFSGWLRRFGEATQSGTADVPCGDCTACCRASHFIHIAPEERRTLARIPRALLAPAPHMPPGHRVLGFDERGHCPMLVDNSCSIYEDRPRTCRTYDCRIFPATGVEDPDPTKVEITRRAGRWRFEHRSPDDQRRHDAARAAATFLRKRCAEMPSDLVPTRPPDVAAVALAIHEHFLDRDVDQVDPTEIAALLAAMRDRP